MISDQLHEATLSISSSFFFFIPMERCKTKGEKKIKKKITGKRIYVVSCDTNYSLIQWQTYIQYDSVHRCGKINVTFKQTYTLIHRRRKKKDEKSVRKENIMMFIWLILAFVIYNFKGKKKKKEEKK